MSCSCLFFFFKQKTAYEMRISDWSSDVCSSDLFETEHVADAIEIGPARFLVDANGAVALDVRMAADRRDARAGLAIVALEEEQIGDLLDEQIGRASCRERVCQYV